MADPMHALAGGFVEPRGMISSVVSGAVAHQVFGVSSTLGDVEPGASPLRKGDIAYLAVYDQELVLFRAKRGAFKPRATEVVIATAPRGAVEGAHVERGKIAGVLELRFTDGTSWAFDVPRVHLGAAEAIAARLVQR